MTLWQSGLITLVLAATAAATALAVIKRRIRRLSDHAPQVRSLCQALTNAPRVLPHHKLVLRALVRCLDLPLDLIPDFIPIIGRLDDQLITALAIRTAMRTANADLIRQHWPGPQPPPKNLLRHAKGRTRSPAASASPVV